MTAMPEGGASDALKVLARAESMGICLNVQGTHIRYRGPMTADLRSDIRIHRGPLLELLRGPAFTTPHNLSVIPLPDYKVWLWREIESARLGVAYTNSPGWVTRVSGDISLEALEKSIELLCERHSALSTRVFESDTQLYMATDRRPRLHVVDLRSGGSGIEAALMQLRWAPFDPRTDALFRPFLIRLGKEDHVIGCVCHHFISDATALDIVVKEWLAAYATHLGAHPSSAEEHPYQYIDYLFEMNRWCKSAGLQHRLHYWKRTLSRGAPSTLPSDFNLAREAYSQLSKTEEFTFDASETRRLRATAASCGVTPINLLLAAHAVAVARTSQMDEVTLRNVDHGRWNPALLRMVGSTDNALCLRVTLDPAEVFTDFARRLQDIHLDAQSQNAPWGLVFGILDEVGTSDAHAVVNIIDHGSAAMIGSPEPAMFGSGPITISTPDLPQSLRHHPPHAFTGLLGASFSQHLKYLDGLYRPESIERFNADCGSITRSVINNPQVTVGELRR
jgi:hypothetical protein